MNELKHYNVKGTNWYKHKFGNWERHAKYANGQPNPETMNGIKVKSYNMSSWGSDADHNTLFITGYSGSGKSTIAVDLRNKRTNVIHLDLFTESIGSWSKADRDPEFSRYLEETGSDFYKISDPEKYGVKKQTKEFGDLLQSFEDSIVDFSRQQYDKGKRVVVEGVQLSDNTLFPDKSYFKDKPLIVTRTNALTSFIRSGIRDEKLNLKDLTPADIKEYVRWYNQMSKNLENVKMKMV